MPDSKATTNTGKNYFVYLIPLLIFSGMVILFIVGLGLNPNLIPSPLIDKPVPEFSLQRLDDPQQKFDHTDLRGNISLFNIWATWCPSCKQEHPVLMQIAASGEAPIYGLYYKDEPELGLQWLKQHGDPYQANAVDLDGRIGIEWGAYGTPETFVIDDKGIIRYKHTGPISLHDWENQILPLIRKLRQDSA